MIIPHNLEEMANFMADLDSVCLKYSQILGKEALLNGLITFTSDTLEKYGEKK